ncbi:ubiquitin family domain-containing protein [Ditylenchus destructor]|uniref:Ubiquitin family domain-containing protein n=1 Tax=Ditylenchus destructor TaxID=166010 RepID=A0AAD4MW36_9BILA|nr:ubiquitin family domain-containing protein [Ditylenchus destructor]
MNYHLLMWIRSLVPLNITPLPAIRRLVSSLDFLYHLRDGTLLAQLANALVPGCVACNFDVNTGDVALNLEKRNRNLEGFVAFLKEHADFGEEFVFHPEDVRNKYDDSYKTVFSCLYKLATEVPEKFGKHGLNIDCVIKDANQEQERNFRLRFKADSLKSRWNNTDCDSVIQLRVMTVHRQIIRLYVDAKDTVSNLKEQLEVKRGIAVQDQRLSFSGNVLDDKLSLSHYGIHNGSEVLCISLKDCEQTLFNGRF